MTENAASTELMTALREMTDLELVYFLAKIIEEQTRRLK